MNHKTREIFQFYINMNQWTLISARKEHPDTVNREV